MINFLPENYKLVVKREYYRRLFLVISIFVLASLVAGSLFMLPFYYFLTAQVNTSKAELSVVEQKKSLREDVSSLAIIDEVNFKTTLYSEGIKMADKKSKIVREVIAQKPADVSLASIVLKDNIVTLKGKANQRQGLKDFTALLKNNPNFTSVDSPNSNFLKNKEVEFTLKIDIKTAL